MIYLLLATLCSALIVIILKLINMRGENATVAITVNYVVGALITFLFSPVEISAGYILHAPWFTMSLIVGFFFIVALVIFSFSVEKSGVAITTISGRAAMAIPVVFAFVALGEKPTALKIGMLAAIIFAMFLILKKDNTQDPLRKRGLKGLHAGLAAVALPLLVFLANGISDTVMQYAKRVLITNSNDNMMFTGTLFVAAAIAGFLLYMFENRGRIPAPKPRAMLWGVFLGATNSICCVAMLYALGVLDGSVFYPLYYVGAVIITTIVGVWAFKEKLSVVNYIGIAIALVAIVLLASN